jgi:PAS domain S-box-containing protein
MQSSFLSSSLAAIALWLLLLMVQIGGTTALLRHLLHHPQLGLLMAATAACTLILTATILIGVWRILRPQAAILAGIQALSQGQFDHRVPLQPGQRAIAQALNQLAESLPSLIEAQIAAAIAPYTERDLTTQAVLQAIPDLMFRVSRDGVYLDYIPTGQHIDVWPSDQKPVGRPLSHSLPPELVNQKLLCIQQALETQQVQLYEQQLRVDGSPRYEEVRVAPCGPDQVLFIIRDITQQRQMERETEGQKVFLRQLLDCMPSLVAVKDAGGRFLQLNRAAAAVYGNTPEALVGQRELDLVPNLGDDTYAEWIVNNEEVMTSRQPKQIGDELITSVDGSQSWYQTMLSPFVDLDGNVKGVICHSVDISDRKRMELELQQSKNRAEAANQAKSAFLSNMSHELRTPLNAILGFAQVIRHDDLVSEEHQEYLDIMIQSSEHLLGLIDNILDMARTETGDLPSLERAVSLQALLRSLQASFQLQAAQKNLSLILEPDPGLPDYVYVDPQKLRQVLTNLLDNAIKFTPHGQVSIQASLTPATSSMGSDSPLETLRERPQRWLQIAIRDTGPGIPPDCQELIFEMFTQLPEDGVMPSGTGVGLALSRRLAHLMGGTLTVTSTPGQGSQFDLIVPISPAHPPQRSEEDPATRLLPEGFLYRIGIAEASQARRLLLSQWLSEAGFQVQLASDRASCLQQLKQWQPHLLILGELPDLSPQTVQTLSIDAATPLKLLRIVDGAGVPPAPTAALSDPAVSSVAVLCHPIARDRLFRVITELLQIPTQYDEDGGTGHPFDPSPTSTSSLAALSAMPPDWIDRLHHAALRCDQQTIRQLIQDIPTHLAALAQTLARLNHQFQFDVMLHYLRHCTPVENLP